MMQIKVDSGGARIAIHAFGEKASDGRIPLRQFYQYVRAAWSKEWNAVKATGGVFRGRVWPKFADQYTRKTDGVTVPAWGGVPRVARGHGKAKAWTDANRRGVSTGRLKGKVSGTVSGRLRNSGKRVTTNSVQLADKGHFRGRILPPRPDITRFRLRLGGSWIKDWEAKMMAKRPVLFFTKQDEGMFHKIADDHLRKLADETNRSK